MISVIWASTSIIRITPSIKGFQPTTSSLCVFIARNWKLFHVTVIPNTQIQISILIFWYSIHIFKGKQKSWKDRILNFTGLWGVFTNHSGKKLCWDFLFLELCLCKLFLPRVTLVSTLLLLTFDQYLSPPFTENQKSKIWNQCVSPLSSEWLRNFKYQAVLSTTQIPFHVSNFISRKQTNYGYCTDITFTFKLNSTLILKFSFLQFLHKLDCFCLFSW